jgi:hypothetical protein
MNSAITVNGYQSVMVNCAGLVGTERVQMGGRECYQTILLSSLVLPHVHGHTSSIHM